MSDEVYGFDKNATERVAAATRRVERQGRFEESSGYGHPMVDGPLCIRVDLVQTGGSAGNATTACSFTYTAKSIDGGTLGTGMTPVCERPSIGKMIAATKGMISWNNSGDMELYYAHEVPAKVKRSCI